MNEFAGILLEVISVTVPVFVVVGIGFFIRRKGFIKAEHVPFLNRLTYNLGLSTLVFKVIADSKFSEIFDFGILKVVYSTNFLFILIIFLSFYFSSLKKRLKGAMIVCSFRNNMAFIGMPVLLYAFGSLAAAKAGIVIAAVAPFNIIFTVLFLQFINPGSEGNLSATGSEARHKKDNKYESKEKDVTSNPGINKKNLALVIIKTIVTDPVVIAAIAGLLISYYNVKLPGPVDKVFEILSGIAIPLALLSIGASFRFSHIKNNIKYLSILNVLKLVLFPSIALFFGLFVFQIEVLDINSICILFAVPVAVSTYIQSIRYRTDHDFISSAIITSTVVSAFSLSLWLLVLKLIEA